MCFGPPRRTYYREEVIYPVRPVMMPRPVMRPVVRPVVMTAPGPRMHHGGRGPRGGYGPNVRVGISHRY